MKNGFTLAEVLITLVIIGVVAALTVPSLINKFKVQQIITQLNGTYTILSQAVKMAEIHNGKIDTWDIGGNDSPESSLKLYNYISPEIKKLQNCKNYSGCFADNYKNLQDSSYTYQPKSYEKYSKGRLNNGASFYTWSGGTGCNLNLSKSNSGSLIRVCGSIAVDINGNNKPNKAGHDFFIFILTKDGLIPAGTKDYNANYLHDCDFMSSKGANGDVCTAWVLYKRNMDYTFKSISW